MISIVGELSEVRVAKGGFLLTIKTPCSTAVDVLWYNPRTEETPGKGEAVMVACEMSQSGRVVGRMLGFSGGIRYAGDNPGSPPPTSPFKLHCC